jgi:hypothetical protein
VSNAINGSHRIVRAILVIAPMACIGRIDSGAGEYKIRPDAMNHQRRSLHPLIVITLIWFDEIPKQQESTL